jgi:hypothetical protein
MTAHQNSDRVDDVPTSTATTTSTIAMISFDADLAVIDDYDDASDIDADESTSNCGRTRLQKKKRAALLVHKQLRIRRRKYFLVFVRILIKLLERSDDMVMAVKVRKMVMECIEYHRAGGQHHPQYKSLVDAVEQRLQILVGEDYWINAKTFLSLYHEWKTTPVVVQPDHSEEGQLLSSGQELGLECSVPVAEAFAV